MQETNPIIALGGSRSLPSAALPLIRRLVADAIDNNYAIATGCACGADAMVASAALDIAPTRLAICAVGAHNGAGFWKGSAPLAGLRSAEARGAQVNWLAGGSLDIPLRARLIRRSIVSLQSAQVAAFFLASPDSPGSLRVAAEAAARGLQVYAFCFGFSGPPRLLSSEGQWAPVEWAGLAGYQWRPTATQPSLF